MPLTTAAINGGQKAQQIWHETALPNRMRLMLDYQKLLKEFVDGDNVLLSW